MNRSPSQGRLPFTRLALAVAGVVMLTVPSLAQQRPAQQRPAAPAQQPAQGQAPAAQQQQGPALVNLKGDPAQEWTKVCGEDPAVKKTICYTTRDFFSAENNQPIMAVAVYDVQNDPKKFVRFLMPLSFLLQPGIRFSIDTAQPVSGRYQICFPNGCFAEAEVNEAFLGNLKKGTNVRISVQNQVGQEIAFVVPLAGFSKAFDGAPIDPKVLEAQRKALEDELQKRAEEMRKQQGGAAPAPGAPAAPAPAAPKQ